MMPPPLHTTKPGFVTKDGLPSVVEVYVQGYPATQHLMGSPFHAPESPVLDGPKIFLSTHTHKHERVCGR